MNQNPTQANAHEDDDLALRQALQQASAPAADSQALQQRVLAQWQQRHAQQAPQGQPTLLGAGPALLLGQTRRQRMARAVVVLALGVALAAWWLRPDPTLNELLQLDVLSQMGMGEI
jgi:hypothetical protein